MPQAIKTPTKLILLLLLCCSFSVSANIIPSFFTRLIAGTSSTNQNSRGLFSLGVTADQGKSFGTDFSEEDSLDVLADIMVAPEHVGKKEVCIS